VLCALVAGLALWSASASAQRKHAFSAEFGGAGSGNGQLSRPGALAVNDATGDVYVVDRGNSRVEVFSASGAYVGQFNGSASPTGAFSFLQSRPAFGHKEEPEGAIAVDNSTSPLDPSAGDVYVADVGHEVIDKFTAGGVYIGQITGTPAGSFGLLLGVAVDANGALLVQLGSHVTPGTIGEDGTLYRFTDASVNEYVSEVQLHVSKLHPDEEGVYNGWGEFGLASDSIGDIYIAKASSPKFPEYREVVSKFAKDGMFLVEALDGESTQGVAVDRSIDDVYADNETSVAAFDLSGGFVERFGSPQMHASEGLTGGVAVNSATGTVYTSDAVNQSLERFTAFVVPDVTTEPASNLGETSVTVNAVVNPDGIPVTSCVFEYGTTTAYGQTVPCSPSPGSGNGPVAVSASLLGLERLTLYHFRVKATNASGSNEGQDHTFLTPEPVTISEESVSDVSSDGAQFTAQVNPGGAQATFSFEYGTSTSYGQSVPVPAGDLGAGTSTEPVSVRAQGLQPETVYHVRLSAANLLGTVRAPDITFTTQPAGGEFALPDGRVWELVSSPIKYGAQIEPPAAGVGQAAEDGSAVAYLTNAPIVPNPAGNPSPAAPNQIVSRRVPGGWSTEDIATPKSAVASGRKSEEYRYFSADLSRALAEPPAGETLLSAEATEPTPYVRANGDGSYLPLVTASNVPAGTRFGPPLGVEMLSATPDLSHVLLASPSLLTSDATVLSEPHAGEAEGHRHIYEWVAGRLTLVDVLPNGTVPDGGRIGDENRDIRGAVSQDGSRIFWVAQPEHSNGAVGPLYMRDIAGSRTVQVDAPAPGVSAPPFFDPTFEIASSSGSKVFFLEDQPLTADSNVTVKKEQAEGGPADLYVYNTEAGTLSDLSVDRNGSEQAGVQSMVLGAAEDGSVVYFVATGMLAAGAEAGKDNLYVASVGGSGWSAPRLIGVLSEEDANTWGRGPNTNSPGYPSRMASRVSPNGRFLAFMSSQGLTGYDNRDASSGQRDQEVFLYDEVTGRLRCVSCNPTGARPAGVRTLNSADAGTPLAYPKMLWYGFSLAAAIPAWEFTAGPETPPVLYQSRYLTNDGRLFFNGFDSLVSQDTNGTADVYEYQPEGVGSCGRSGGCVSLISSGTSGQESALLDVSGRGPGGGEAEDVFFLTASRLVSQDHDASLDVYDAHVCSSAVPCVSPPVTPVECSNGDSCQGGPTPQPSIFGAPASATFSGVGNLLVSPPAPVVAPPRLTSAQKRALAFKACHRKRSRKVRATCERQAKRRYPVRQARRVRRARARVTGRGAR
jgi:hypothetical protein